MSEKIQGEKSSGTHTDLQIYIKIYVSRIKKGKGEKKPTIFANERCDITQESIHMKIRG